MLNSWRTSTLCPNQINPETNLDATGIYLPSEVDASAKFVWDPKGRQTHMEPQAKLTPPLERFQVRLRE